MYILPLHVTQDLTHRIIQMYRLSSKIDSMFRNEKKHT